MIESFMPNSFLDKGREWKEMISFLKLHRVEVTYCAADPNPSHPPAPSPPSYPPHSSPTATFLGFMYTYLGYNEETFVNSCSLFLKLVCEVD